MGTTTPPHCRVCGQFHWGVCAINKPEERLTGAINTVDIAINSKPYAINRLVESGVVRVASEVRVDEDSGSAEGAATKAKTPNRRSREDYNAYMREYMKARRSK